MNNMYHVRSGTDRAVLFNDQSVQENYHLYLGFQVMRHDSCNFMEQLKPEISSEIRRNAINMVLHTDMSKVRLIGGAAIDPRSMASC